MVEVAASSSLCRTDKTTLPTSSKTSTSAYVMVQLFFFFFFKAMAISKAQTSALLLVDSFKLSIAKPHKQELIGFFPTRAVWALRSRLDNQTVQFDDTSLWLLIGNDWLKQCEDKLNHDISMASLGSYKPSITRPFNLGINLSLSYHVSFTQ